MTSGFIAGGRHTTCVRFTTTWSHGPPPFSTPAPPIWTVTSTALNPCSSHTPCLTNRLLFKICLSVCLSVCMSFSLGARPSVCMSVFLSVLLHVCLSDYISVCLYGRTGVHMHWICTLHTMPWTVKDRHTQSFKTHKHTHTHTHTHMRRSNKQTLSRTVAHVQAHAHSLQTCMYINIDCAHARLSSINVAHIIT